MMLHLLVSKEMQPLPHNITVVENYGNLDLMSDGTPPEIYHSGDHMVVEGDEEAIRSWLSPFDGFWLGDGPPVFQQFKIVHINS